MRDVVDQSATYTGIYRNWGWEQALWRFWGVALTGLQFLSVCMRAECVVGKIRLGCSIHWFVYQMGLGTEMTRQLQPPVCI